MLPSDTLLRSPSQRILAQVQKDILAEVPQFYNEDTDARPKLALSDADVPGGKIWAQTTLLKERQELCEGITKEIRVVQGCHTLANALGAQEWSRDLSVTMTFATSRIEQLQADLKANSALISTALLHADKSKLQPAESLMEQLARLLASNTKADFDVIKRACGQRQSITPLPHHSPTADTLTHDVSSCFVAYPPVMTSPPKWTAQVSQFVLRHYHEMPDLVSREMDCLLHIRSSIWRTAAHNSGQTQYSQPTSLLTRSIKYYHHVCQMEDRFLAQGRLQGVFFPWHHWLNGKLYLCERVVAEKCGVLASAASFATQAALEESFADGISAGRARTFFEISAGLLELAVTTVEEDFLEQHDRAQLSALADVQQYGNIDEHGWDVDVLRVMLAFSLAQAQECHWKAHLFDIESKQRDNALLLPDYSEASAVARMYGDAKRLILLHDVCGDDLPEEWIGTIYVKKCEYDAISNFLCAKSILTSSELGPGCRKEAVQRIRKALESIRLAIDTCRDDPKGRLAALEARCKLDMQEILSVMTRHHIADEPTNDSIMGCISTPEGHVKRWAQPICLPSLTPAKDLFQPLGRPYFFNALCPLVDRRKLCLIRTDQTGSWGFALQGAAPCRILSVAPGSPADHAGLQVGSFLLSINKLDVRSRSHEQVVLCLQACKRAIKVIVVDNPGVEDSLNPEEEYAGSEGDTSDMIEFLSLMAISDANGTDDFMEYES